jgi:hypothetical protein
MVLLGLSVHVYDYEGSVPCSEYIERCTYVAQELLRELLVSG